MLDPHATGCKLWHSISWEHNHASFSLASSFFVCFHLFTNFPEASALLNGFCSKRHPLTIVMWVACFWNLCALIWQRNSPVDKIANWAGYSEVQCVCVCVLHAVSFMKAQYTHVQMGCFKMDIHIEVLTQIIYIYTQACKYTTIKKVNSYTERKSWQKNATVNDPCKIMFYI